MHICIVTTAHPIDDVRVYQKFCRSFLEKGFSVTWVGPEWRQVDQSFAGDPRVQYRLVPPLPGKVGRYRVGLRVAELATEVEGVDWFYAPDPDSAKIAAKASKASKASSGRKARSIFDIHENYHDAPVSRWLGRLAWPWVREMARGYIAGIAAKCDVVIAVNESILKSYAPNHARTGIVRSCAPLWFADKFVARNESLQPFRIMHGKADLGRGTLQVLQALKLLREEDLVMKVVMIESASDQTVGEAGEISNLMASESKAIERQKRVGMQEMPGLLCSCAAGMISYQRDLGVDSLPNRLFEYMAAGLAVIAPIYSSEIVEILEAEGCGILVDFEDPLSIASAMRSLVEDTERCAKMGRAGREAFLARHNWEVEFDRGLALINFGAAK